MDNKKSWFNARYLPFSHAPRSAVPQTSSNPTDAGAYFPALQQWLLTHLHLGQRLRFLPYTKNNKRQADDGLKTVRAWGKFTNEWKLRI